MIDVEKVRKFFDEGKNFKPLTVKDLLEFLDGMDPDTVLCKYLNEGGPIFYPIAAAANGGGFPLYEVDVGEEVYLDDGRVPRPAEFPILIFESVD
jgi:hypothetical protein